MAVEAVLPQSIASSRSEATIGIENIANNNIVARYPDLAGPSFTYRRDEEIFGDGEDADYVYRVVRGAVRSCKTLPDGRRQINAFHIEGDLFGLEGDAAHRLAAEAISDTTVILLRRRPLEALAARDATIACHLWTMTARSLRQAEDHIVRLGRRGAVERVAAFLLEIDNRLGCPGEIQLPMPRRDIGDYLGLTIETVSRSLSQLQSQQALTLPRVRTIRLNKPILTALVEN